MKIDFHSLPETNLTLIHTCGIMILYISISTESISAKGKESDSDYSCYLSG